MTECKLTKYNTEKNGFRPSIQSSQEQRQPSNAGKDDFYFFPLPSVISVGKKFEEFTA